MSRRTLLAIALAAMTAIPAAAVPVPGPGEELPVALQKVPPDASAFLHVRHADLSEHPLVRPFRDGLPGDAEVQTVTAFLVGRGDAILHALSARAVGRARPVAAPPTRWAIIVTTRKPYDRQAVLRAWGATGEADPRGMIPLGNSRFAFLHFTTPTVFALIGADQADAYLKATAGSRPPQFVRIAADEQNLLVARAVPGRLGLQSFAEAGGIPQPYAALGRAESVLLTVPRGDPVRARLVLNTRGPSAAEELEKGARDALKDLAAKLQAERRRLGRDPVRYAVPILITDLALEAMKRAAISRESQSVALAAELPADKDIVPRLVRAAALVRKARLVMTKLNHFKQIGLALHNYHDAFGRLPGAAITDNNGKPLLSWRVAILPFIEQDHIYKRFKLDEPWDSEHNRKLLDQMPTIYAQPGAKKGETKTHFRVFAGKRAAFELNRGLRFAAITDGLSNTILVAEADEAVPWTKPDELEYDPEKPLPKLLFDEGGRVLLLLCDGSVHRVSKEIPEQTWRRLIERADGQPIREDFRGR
ncbi:MAG TPA: DUF1559 domain-containing protein [Gemmataceae bacterium]